MLNNFLHSFFFSGHEVWIKTQTSLVHLLSTYRLATTAATQQQQQDLAEQYRAGGLGYGHAKQALFEVVDEQLAEPREKYNELKANPDEIRAVLEDGANRARTVARATMDRVRSAVGL